MFAPETYPMALVLMLTSMVFWGSWPNFLKTDNLLNIANQIVVIAVIAVVFLINVLLSFAGMTPIVRMK